MKTKISKIAIVVFFVVFLLECSGKSDFFIIKRKAYSEYKKHLAELNIRPDLFKGPELDLSNEECLIFQWKSIIPYEGALKLRIYIDEKGKVDASTIGDTKNWSYVLGSAKHGINGSIFAQMFNSNIAENSKEIDSVKFTNDEQFELVKFIQIKHALIDYFIRNGSYPQDLEDLNIEPRLIRDKNGYKFGYNHHDGYILLFAKGTKNTKLQMDELNSLTLEKCELLRRIDGAIIVKFRLL